MTEDLRVRCFSKVSGQCESLGDIADNIKDGEYLDQTDFEAIVQTVLSVFSLQQATRLFFLVDETVLCRQRELERRIAEDISTRRNQSALNRVQVSQLILTDISQEYIFLIVTSQREVN